jgi:hypothetical protein
MFLENNKDRNKLLLGLPWLMGFFRSVAICKRRVIQARICWRKMMTMDKSKWYGHKLQQDHLDCRPVIVVEHVTENMKHGHQVFHHFGIKLLLFLCKPMLLCKGFYEELVMLLPI